MRVKGSHIRASRPAREARHDGQVRGRREGRWCASRLPRRMRTSSAARAEQASREERCEGGDDEYGFSLDEGANSIDEGSCMLVLRFRQQSKMTEMNAANGVLPLAK